MTLRRGPRPSATPRSGSSTITCAASARSRFPRKISITRDASCRARSHRNSSTLSYLRYRYGFSTDYWERYPAKLNAVSAAEIQAVAQKYFRPDRAHIVAAGDGAQIRPALAKYGTVETG